MDDRKATFLEWYDTDMPDLFNYIISNVSSRGQAEEILSTVCERALARINQFDPRRGELKDWMFGIALNEVRMYFRRAGRTPRMVSIDELPLPIPTEDNIERTVQQRDLYQQAMCLFPQLTDQQREVLTLKYSAGYRNKEIADMMNIDERHVAVIVHRALAKLRELMDRQVERVSRD